MTHGDVMIRAAELFNAYGLNGAIERAPDDEVLAYLRRCQQRLPVLKDNMARAFPADVPASWRKNG
jgi:hypothetical protein